MQVIRVIQPHRFDLTEIYRCADRALQHRVALRVQDAAADCNRIAHQGTVAITLAACRWANRLAHHGSDGTAALHALDVPPDEKDATMHFVLGYLTGNSTAALSRAPTPEAVTAVAWHTLTALAMAEATPPSHDRPF